ncbi:heavy-metal-associated domain-containing protein [Halobacteria archaeon AArc-curdl1]|uniref:Heavy-metal-associated domain-containing protein n=1 Tax=Natronosalvus hydrolyticus TaxID=2979988 RepID=A0AAP2Z7Z9_9EURY|nr:heavy-metal-associated domain-containing protein [Halobacteria archaeon AArc-curdl1]
MTRKHTDIHGLHCPNCALTLERAIATLRGVRGARVEFETETVSVEYDPAAVSLERINSRIRSATCESACFDMSAPDRTFGNNDRESGIARTPSNHSDGCCQIVVDGDW